MEWVRGIPLSVLLEKTLTSDCAMTLASAIISCLSNLHKNNVAHCDLKPENILITSDFRVSLVDFGFSQLHNSPNLSTGILQGTPAYMAPELWSARETIDYKKVDLYALGILLSRLLGTMIPSFTEELTATDPELRPCDCVSFEKKWRSQIQCSSAPAAVCSTVPFAVDEYIAQMLLQGARELYGKKRYEDAYAICTESLNIWPDNPEALEFLQSKFSLPKKVAGRKLAVFTAIVAIILAISSAYIIGTQTSEPVDIFSNISLPQEEKRLVFPAASPHGNSSTAPSAVALRQTGGGLDLTGAVKIVRTSEKGSLFIDGKLLADCTDGEVSVLLRAGTHRIEWYDSLLRRRFGETVALLPFEKKTVSLKRFLHGK
jgi:serine/threonine protein kinase